MPKHIRQHPFNLTLVGWALLGATACQSPPQDPMGQGNGGQQPTPVEMVRVETGSVRDSSVFVASLDSRQSATINPQVSGQVSQVFVRLGDSVETGTPLFQVDPVQQQAAITTRMAAVEVAQANVDNARANLRAAQADLLRAEADVEFERGRQERYSQLLAEGAVSREFVEGIDRDLQQAEAVQAAQQEQIQALEAALTRAERDLDQAAALVNEQQVQLGFFEIVAPLSGTVGEVRVNPGDYVTPQTALTTITQSQTLELAISIPLDRAAELRLGLPVELLGSDDQPLSQSQISFIAPDVDPFTQAVVARAVFDNTQGQLRPSQFVRVRLTWDQTESPLIPVNAVTRVAGQTFVYVAEPGEGGSPDGPPALIAQQRLVQLGQLQDNQYQVISGLDPGEQIVATGLQKIFDQAPIIDEQVFQQMMQQMGGGEGGPPPEMPPGSN